MHSANLLSEENNGLHIGNERQKMKRQVRRSYNARGGILAVEEGPQLAEERSNRSRG
jgi:hypothetical protein